MMIDDFDDGCVDDSNNSNGDFDSVYHTKVGNVWFLKSLV